MKYPTFALATIISATSAAAEPHLVLRLIADEHIIQPGESVHWQLWAELYEPQDEILATVSNIAFSLTFGGVPSLSITDNDFSTAFDSTFFGPADDGTVSFDTISTHSRRSRTPADPIQATRCSSTRSPWSTTATAAARCTPQSSASKAR